MTEYFHWFNGMLVMDRITLMAVIGFLLVAAAISSRKQNPWVMLAGMAIVVGSVTVRLWGGGSFLATAQPLFTDAGLGLLAIGSLLSIRKPKSNSKAQPRPFFLLGVLSFIMVIIVYLVNTYVWPKDQASLVLELGSDDHIEEVEGVLRRYNATAEQAFPTVTLEMDEDLAQIYLIHGDARVTDALMAALARDTENVDHVEMNISISLPPFPESTFETVSAPYYLEDDPRVAEQWALDAIRGHEAHALLSELSPVRKAHIAILDTGVEGDHEDLQAVFNTEQQSSDKNGHGTHCAGIAGAATNNSLGIASLNWNGAFVELSSYEALDSDGTGTIEKIAQAVIDASQAGVDVISMSLGGVALTTPRVLVHAIEFAYRSGAIVAAAAGNSNQDASNHFPSNIDGTFAIAAVDRNLNKASFSNTVGRLSRPLAAPGVDILSSYPAEGYSFKSGTSMATPVVTGLLGIMRSLAPGMSSEDAYNILHETGQIVEDTPRVGRVIDAEAALLATLEFSSS